MFRLSTQLVQQTITRGFKTTDILKFVGEGTAAMGKSDLVTPSGVICMVIR